jgi:DNA-binding transcriptional ArsR family regulator
VPRATAKRRRSAGAAVKRAQAPHGGRGAAVFRALADDTRRGILALLAEGPTTAGAIAAAFPEISRPAVSKHLAVLRDAGLVVDEASGRERVYSLRTDPLGDVVAYVSQIDEMWRHALVRLGKHLDEA